MTRVDVVVKHAAQREKIANSNNNNDNNHKGKVHHHNSKAFINDQSVKDGKETGHYGNDGEDDNDDEKCADQTTIDGYGSK